MELQLSHAQTAKEPRDRDAEQDLPHDPQRLAERVPHLVLERLPQRRDRRDRRERDLDALGELREEGGRELPLQLVLQDRSAGGDAPDLKTIVLSSIIIIIIIIVDMRLWKCGAGRELT